MQFERPRLDSTVTLADGRSLGFAEWGDPGGEPVLFFHGTPGSRLNPWCAEADIRSIRVRLIAVDRPGIGSSDAQRGRTLLDWPTDVAALVDALGIERFAVLGFSNGGPHAAACAHALSERLAAAALVSPMPPPDRDGTPPELGVPAYYFPLIRWAPWIMRGVYGTLVRVARRRPAHALRLIASDFNPVDRAVLDRPEVAPRFVADLVEAGARGIVEDERLMTRTWGFWPKELAIPTRLWHGEEDGIVPIRHARAYAEALPRCEARLIPGEGHFLIEDHMAEILDDLVSAVRAAPARHDYYTQS